MYCIEKQQIYRQCIEANTKARECRAELDALFSCIREAEMKKKYLYVL
jgi:hypothetical protein